MASYDSQRRSSRPMDIPQPYSQQRYDSPARNADYDPYATPPQSSPRSNAYGPQQPIVTDQRPPQHPGLRRESRSYQPPPGPQMGHPGMPQMPASYQGAPPPPQPQYGSSPSYQQPYQGQYQQQPYGGQFSGQPGSYPPTSYPQSGLHPSAATGTSARRDSRDHDESAIRFDDSAHSHPSSGHRPRAYSTASRHSRRSGSEDRDGDRDYDDREYDERRRRRSSGGSHHHKHYEEERRVTVGDSMMWAIKGVKDLLSSKRE